MRDDNLLERFGTIDPVDDAVLAERVPAQEWQDMAARITTSKHRRPPWRRPVFRIVAVACVGVSVLALTSAVAVDRTIVVQATDALRNPEAVERELAKEGITAEVHVVPVKDDLVGKWFHLYVDPSADIDEGTFALLKSYVGEIDMGYDEVEARCPLGGCERTGRLEIPGDVKGPITLVAGREAGPGEEYWAKYMDWGNELAPSGAFYCLALEEKSPEEAGAILEAKGYRVSWSHSAPENGSSHGVDGPVAGSGLVVAYTFEPGTVKLYTHVADDTERGRRLSGTPTAESGRPDFGTC